MTRKTKTRVLVVEDSLTVRRHLVDVLGRDSDIEVVGEADDGQRAIELCRALRPDVITMDIVLPHTSGLKATEYIMAHFPTPILIVSSSMERKEVFQTYEALAAGALDVLDKPSGTEADDEWEQRLLAAVKLVARIRVITHVRARFASRAAGITGPALAPSAASPPPSSSVTSVALRAREEPHLVAIGASTGGPGAVVDVLRGLPASFSLPILLVIHLNEPFGKAFAEWLDAQTSHRVRYPEEGALVSAAAGNVIMAPPGRHLVVQGGRMWTNRQEERHSCRPSVAVLFASVAKDYGAAAAGCLLTGMGKDGAAGLLAIRQAGGRTLAQDEASCVVYGMPREAALIGAAERVVGLAEMGAAIGAWTRREARA